MNSSRKEKILVALALLFLSFLGMTLFFLMGLLIDKVIFNAELSFEYVLTYFTCFLSCVSYFIEYLGVLALLSFRKKH